MSDWKQTIEDAKKLLDLGAITQEQFEKIRDNALKYLPEPSSVDSFKRPSTDKHNFLVNKKSDLPIPPPSNLDDLETRVGNVGGETIGNYIIQDLLGEGGMGVVYRARHKNEQFAEGTGDVAIKMIRPSLSDNAEFRTRFINEAIFGKRLLHPNIANVIDVYDENGVLALLMEYVDGKHISDLIPEDGMPVDEVVQLLTPIAEALEYLHGQGIVHRDMKPANVRVKPDGTPVILDFGIAKDINETDQGITQTNTTMGTQTYMAPEQMDAKSVTGTADQYALAMMAYQMLSGRLPWDESLSSVQIIMAKMTGDLKELSLISQVPRTISDIVMKALNLDPMLRFDDCIDFVQALSPISESAKQESGNDSSSQVESENTMDHWVRSAEDLEQQVSSSVDKVHVNNTNGRYSEPNDSSENEQLPQIEVKEDKDIGTSEVVEDSTDDETAIGPTGHHEILDGEDLGHENSFGVQSADTQETGETVAIDQSPEASPFQSNLSEKNSVSKVVSSSKHEQKQVNSGVKPKGLQTSTKTFSILIGVTVLGILFFGSNTSTNISTIYQNLLVDQDGRETTPIDKKLLECNSDPEKCFELGMQYRDGSPYKLDFDYASAIRLFKFSCSEQHATACIELGYMYRVGLGMKANERMSMKFYKQAERLLDTQCQQSDKIACRQLANLYDYYLIDINDALAYNNYFKACTLKDADSCWAIWSDYWEEEDRKFWDADKQQFVVGRSLDEDWMKIQLESLCSGGDTESCVSVAYAYYYGDPPFKKNKYKTKEYLDLAFSMAQTECNVDKSEINKPKDCAILGGLYREHLDKNFGYPSPQNIEKSRQYYTEACLADASGCYGLLNLYRFHDEQFNKNQIEYFKMMGCHSGDEVLCREVFRTAQ